MQRAELCQADAVQLVNLMPCLPCSGRSLFRQGGVEPSESKLAGSCLAAGPKGSTRRREDWRGIALDRD